jgi:ABC-type uncharacterized transport system ATPase subunit
MDCSFKGVHLIRLVVRVSPPATRAADLVGADLDHFVASLRRLRKRGKAILLATRDLDFARWLATRIVFMENGTMVELMDPNASRQTFNAASYLAELVG